jgi:hypothetical protein
MLRTIIDILATPSSHRLGILIARVFKVTMKTEKN